MADIAFEKDLSVAETGIGGLKVVDLAVHGDSRGWFKENWQRAKMCALGIPDLRVVQNNVSYNDSRGVTRGIHAEPWDKFISVARGSVFGAWVDLREGSETYGKVYTCTLDPSKAIYVPRGVGNSFQALEDGTAYTYLVDAHWSLELKRTYTFVNLADPELAIEWPIPLAEATVSEADLNHPMLKDVVPMAPKRTLVTGCNGQLGHAVRALAEERGVAKLITLADFYGVSVDYLLCRTENREQINTPLTELHLNDEMVALLKGGRINNRLLCELATHKDFIKFLADIEIYVDGIATMQIQNLNALVDTVRHEIIERYRPGEDDPHLKVLQAAHISDDEYFSHMVLDDLNLIIRDIREAHKKDSESAPQTTVADELKENLEAVENFKGSRDEKLVVLYCKQLGINYKNLSDEEFRWLIRILQKSKKTGTPISQRKKR